MKRCLTDSVFHCCLHAQLLDHAQRPSCVCDYESGVVASLDVLLKKGLNQSCQTAVLMQAVIAPVRHLIILHSQHYTGHCK